MRQAPRSVRAEMKEKVTSQSSSAASTPQAEEKRRAEVSPASLDLGLGAESCDRLRVRCARKSKHNQPSSCSFGSRVRIRPQGEHLAGAS